MTRYLSVEQVVSLHQGLIGLLSGDPGIRDLRALDAAVAKPTLVFDGEDLYPVARRQGGGAAPRARDDDAVCHRLEGHGGGGGGVLSGGQWIGARRDRSGSRRVDDRRSRRAKIGIEGVTVWVGQRVGRG